MVPSTFFVHSWLFLGRRCSIGDAFRHVVVGTSSSSLLLVGCEDGRSFDRGVHPTFVLPCPTSACWSSTLSPWVGFPTTSTKCGCVGVWVCPTLPLCPVDWKGWISNHTSVPLLSHTQCLSQDGQGQLEGPKHRRQGPPPSPPSPLLGRHQELWRSDVAYWNPRRRQEDMLVKRKASH